MKPAGAAVGKGFGSLESSLWAKQIQGDLELRMIHSHPRNGTNIPCSFVKGTKQSHKMKRPSSETFETSPSPPGGSLSERSQRLG